jgi:UDP-N-acetylmuramyl pentapeptide synthase
MSGLKDAFNVADLRLHDLPKIIIGVAGYDGEVVKELTEGALRESFKVSSAAVNAKNACESRALLYGEGGSEILVLELKGESEEEIKELASLFRLTHGVVTCKGIGIGIADSPLLSCLSYNSEDDELEAAIKTLAAVKHGAERISVGFGNADLRITEVSQTALESGGTCLLVSMFFKGVLYQCTVKAFGRRHAINAAFAFSAGLALGAPPEEISRGLAEAVLPPGMGRLFQAPGGGFLIDESHAANPDSVSYSIKNIIDFRTPGDPPKFAILGGMSELGVESLYRHEIVMSRASLLDGVYLIGREWNGVVTDQGSLRGRWDNTDDFLDDFDPSLLSGAITLVTGSSGYGMEKISSLLSRPKETERCL